MLGFICDFTFIPLVFHIVKYKIKTPGIAESNHTCFANRQIICSLEQIFVCKTENKHENNMSKSTV